MARPSTSLLYETLKDAHDWGVLLALAEYGVFATVWPDSYRGLAPDSLRGTLNLCVFLASVFWFLIFRQRTRYEMRILQQKGVLKRLESVLGVDWDVNWVAVPLALGFGALGAESGVPFTYCIIASCLALADCIGLSVIQRSFFIAKEELRLNLDPVFYKFYMYYPHFLQRTLKLAGFMSGLALAVAGKFSHNPRYDTASSVIAIVTIVTGESVLFVWRRPLDSSKWVQVNSKTRKSQAETQPR